MTNNIALEGPAPYSGLAEKLSEEQILKRAESILFKRFERSCYLTSPEATRRYLTTHFADKTREVFSLIFMDSQHGVLGIEDLFTGTIDSASVYPREIVKDALSHEAAAVIFAHNHPSGTAEPSTADQHITTRINTALETIDIRVLDHLVIGGTVTVSFAERGLL